MVSGFGGKTESEGAREMNKGWNRWDTVILLLGLVPLVFAWTVYDRLPDLIPSHYGLNGQPDDFSDKLSFILMMSGLNLGLPFLIKWMPAVDPRRKNYRKFSRFYGLFRFAITLFFSGMFTMILLKSLGYPIDIAKVVMLGIGLLWMLIGNYLGQVRSNWFFGIKLPWTLESDEVWRRTHRISGGVWMGAGLMILLSSFLPLPVAFWTVAIAVAGSVLVPGVYSYLLFQKLNDHA